MKSITSIPTSIAFVLTIALAGCTESGAPDSTAPAVEPEPVPEVAADRATVAISNAMSGWLHTGLEIDAGDSVVLSGNGVWSAEGVNMEPRHMLWYRIGEEGAARNFSANQEIFSAETRGALFVTLRPLGVYWDDARGTYPPGFSEAPAIPVDVSIEILLFQGPLESGLAALAAAGETDAVTALSTLDARRQLPDGFFYLPYLARSNVWAAGTVDGRSGIRAETSDDVGIVKLPLDIPLTEDTAFSFEWRYDSLPAMGPETEAQFHDYLSIALEFDNGQDLTWMWSPELDAGTHFGCPLPWWDSRETHYVLTSGRENLGTWESHTRSVLADYRESISVAEPARIIGIWFIANSLFGRQPGAASFANVSISNGDTRTTVFGE
jgi:hypothetical protein